MKEKPFPFRYVDVRGARYLRIEDVVSFVRVIGSSEETDVRSRLEDAARQITCAGDAQR